MEKPFYINYFIKELRISMVSYFYSTEKGKKFLEKNLRFRHNIFHPFQNQILY